MDGIKSLLKSRKVALAVVGLASVLLAHYSGLPSDVQAAIVALFGAVILGIAAEDSAEKAGAARAVQERLRHYVGPHSGAPQP
jgi:hypothetical protein